MVGPINAPRRPSMHVPFGPLQPPHGHPSDAINPATLATTAPVNQLRSTRLGSPRMGDGRAWLDGLAEIGPGLG